MSPRICLSCRRLNPPLAAYCYFDGTPLAAGTRAPRAFGSEAFPTPFLFPSGRPCRSFEELAHTCRSNWSEARRLLQEGGYHSFLLVLGRSDLAQAAQRAATYPDLDLGLDDFLARLPGGQPTPPHLDILTAEIDLGSVARGQDRTFTLTLANTGERLLCGLVRSVDCLWLGVSTAHLNEKRFQATAGEQVKMPIHIRGNQLRAMPKPQLGALAVESNGGVRSIPVHIRVPVTPFADGVFKGAQSPRQLAEKARTAPQEMARLIENGTIAHWYQSNGWKYPFRRTGLKGLPAVQLYLKALGLATSSLAAVEQGGGQEANLPSLPRAASPTRQVVVTQSDVMVFSSPQPGVGLPPLPVEDLPPLPVMEPQGSDLPTISLGEAREDSAGASSRRKLSCICLLLSLLLLISSAALAAWKLLIADRESSPRPASGKSSSAIVAPPPWDQGCGRQREGDAPYRG